MRFLLCVWFLVGGLAYAQAPALNYDVINNAPLAHVMRAGPVADASQTGFLKYVRDMNGRWKPGSTHEGVKGAFLPGLQANLWLPGGGDLVGSNYALDVRFAPIGSKQRMDVFVNGKKIANRVLEPGWQTHRIKIPDGVITKADNHVRLHFRKTVTHQGRRTAAFLRYARLTGQNTPATPTDEPGIAALFRATDGKTLNLPDGGGLDYFIVPPKGARLRGTTDKGALDVWVQRSGGGPQRIGGGSSVDLDLKADGKPMRLMLRGQGDTRLVSGIIGSAQPGTVPQVKAPKYVVFWLIDTLRADKLGFYDRPNANGRPKVSTPNLDALVKESVVFQNFWVQGNESKSSHASLFTGTYPAQHGVFTHKANLKNSHTTLAEAFTGAGYLSGGYVSNGYISSRWNFAQGFKKAVFSNFIRENKANNARAVTKAAIRFLDRHHKKPFYLYLGTSDPHVTYRAHKDLIGKYDTGPAYKGNYRRSLSGTELGQLKSRKSLPSARDRARIEALYENEIEFNDRYFGKLVAHLKSLGIYDDTMIIISSDHGDEFWEHGSCGHGQNLHQELISVPLVVRLPKLFPAGRSVQFGVDGADLLPTIQSILGTPVSADVQGDSVLPLLWAQGEPYPVAQIASMGTRRYAMQVGPSKAIMGSEKSIRVFDASADAAELKDIFKTHPIYARASLDPLSLFMSRAKTWKKRDWGAPNNLKAAFR